MALNPVERRLAYLCERWSRFTADPSKRLLIWQVPDNAVRIVQCFFEVQKHETEYTTRDLFIVFDTPFQNSVQYSRALKESLAGQYEASRNELVKQGIAPDWAFVPGAVPHSGRGFIQGLASFGSRHHTAIGHLVAALTPSQVDAEADDAFAEWLVRALDRELPERLRLVVVDSIETPRLDKLRAAGHPAVHVDSPEIDALETARETFAQEAAVGPAGVFRNLLMGLVTLVDKGRADQVKARAADAVAFARKQGWADQEVVIAVLVAGALLKEKRFDEALKVYAHARGGALKAVAAGHPAGSQLVLQTSFGEAGTHLAAGNPLRAADGYREAAAIAQHVPNLVLAIEAHRMDAFCRARGGDGAAAIEAGFAAMNEGGRLKPDARPMTTLPIAIVDLMRVLDPSRVAVMEDVRHRLGVRELEAQATAERRAAELENEHDADRFEQVESDLALQLETATQDADRELQAVAAAGDARFVESFQKGRALLGSEWPLTTLAALPAPAAGADRMTGDARALAP